MFFLDSAGFFSLVSLIIQCVTAWVFVGFLSSMRLERSPWLRRWRAAFVGLGVALTAMTLRFLLAHHHVADVALVAEGEPLTRLCYAFYLGGKFAFLCGLVGGIAALRGRSMPRWSCTWPAAAAAFVTGLLLPSAEACLLVQALPMAAGFALGAFWLRAPAAEVLEHGERMVAQVLSAWAVVWLIYGVCTVQVGLVGPVSHPLWSIPLRINPLIDLTLQVLLATGLVVIALQQAQRVTLAALHERDQLREQLQRDERLRSLSALVGGVAHEINNPLTAILGYADELDDPEVEVRREAAQVVREQAARCRHIVQRLSQLGSRASLAPQDVDVEALATRVARGFQPQFVRASVTLRTTIAPECGALRADPTAIEQVLTNLVANALHASPPGGLVELRAQAREDAVQLEVVDEGPGVPLEKRARIFEPYWTTKESGEGTGLGLAVVKALVQAHGGTVEVETATTGGARFVVVLPRQAPGVARAVTQESRTLPVAGPPPSGRRLLVIDDEDAVRQTILRHAQGAGWQTVGAASAEAGLRALAEEAAFDAIVCDLRMPGIGGVGLHDQLGAASPEVLEKVVFVTGDMTSSASADFVARCRQPVVVKPFAFAELFARLDQIAAGRRDRHRSASL